MLSLEERVAIFSLLHMSSFLSSSLRIIRSLSDFLFLFPNTYESSEFFKTFSSVLFSALGDSEPSFWLLSWEPDDPYVEK